MKPLVFVPGAQRMKATALYNRTTLPVVLPSGQNYFQMQEPILMWII